MRIGFDISQVEDNKAGCGYFADSLISSLAKLDHQNHYLLYSSFGDFYINSSSVIPKRLDQSNIEYSLHHTTPHAARSFWENPPENFEEHLGLPDIIHSNNFFCPRNLKHAKLVYTLYDLSFLEYPECTMEANRIGCFDGVFQASLSAVFIIAISEHSRRHFLKIFPHYPEERIAVVYPASRFAPKEIAKPEQLSHLHEEKFWLSVGTIEPRKNHLGLLKAYAKLKEKKGPTFPLVFVGGSGWLMETFVTELENLGLSKDVILLGYVDDATLQWLYQNCFATLYPSLFEGFGLPVLEAMTLGAPVITSNTSSIPEITADAALLVNPLDDTHILQAMLKLSNDENYRKQLKHRGVERAKQFSWQQAATQTLQIYQHVITLPKVPPSTAHQLLQQCTV